MNICRLVINLVKKIKYIFILKILKNNNKYIDKIDGVVCNKDKCEEYYGNNQDEIKHNVNTYKLNMNFSKIEEYIDFLENELKKGISLLNIHIDIWNKFNRYNFSKFTTEKMDEFERLFYLVLEQFQYYCDENNILLINRWGNEKENRKSKIVNDISFLVRYSENLLRYKYNYKRFLTYEKLQNIEYIKIYLDNKFKSIICKRENEIIFSTPNVILDLSIEESDLIDSITLDSIKNLENKQNLIKESNSNDYFLKINSDNIYDNKELNRIIDDIDDFDI